MNMESTAQNVDPCGNCDTACGGGMCTAFQGKLPSYDGIRFTADGFDCALPVSIDPFNTCSFDCLYCFSNFLSRDPKRKESFRVGVMPISQLERFLDFDAGSKNQKISLLQSALRREKGPRCPVQLGALGDPFDNIERHRAWTLEAIPLFSKYNQPVRVSTKGGLLLQEEQYLRALGPVAHLFWVAFSIISIDDDVLKKIDRFAPNATERLAAMKRMSELGARTSLRLRPIIRNVTDRTPRHRKAWRDLMRRSRDAGAGAVSMEFMFVPGVQPPHIEKRINAISDMAGFDMTKFYKSATSRWGACLRASRSWKEELTFAIREEAHALGMVFSVSDPHWKELNDTGCCCGMLPDDPVFGNWERENGTNALVTAKAKYDAGLPALMYVDDIVPPWAYEQSIIGMCLVGGVKGAIAQKYTTWADKLINTWNDPKNARAPLHYFGGVARPHSLDANKNMVYEYVDVPRKNVRCGWDV